MEHVGTLEHINRKIESCEFVIYPKKRYVGLHVQFWPYLVSVDPHVRTQGRQCGISILKWIRLEHKQIEFH